ncbi:serine hydrolase [Aquibaculum sediminis]|uniref:serine hydrolase n=1 Tax=Aquibaculum sediminis TaxID=3231907 RepID=UPI00345662A5
MPFPSLFHPVSAAALLLIAPAVAFADVPDGDLPPPQTTAVPVPAGQIEAAIEQLDERAEALMERSGIPGIAVAVVHEGQTVYAAGFGLRKVGEEATVDPDTVFQLASLSKSISATVVAQQVAEGVVGWDTPIIEFLPDFKLADPWVTEHVTVGDLFSHRSGLPDHAGDDLEDLGYTREEVLSRLHLLPLSPFRDTYAYTNFGLTAAAEAVAAAADLDWESLAEDALYEPLGMSSTSSRFADYAARENRAHGHVRVGDDFEALYVRQPDAQSPAGGVSASVNDMARWMALLLQDGRFEEQQILPPGALLEPMTAKMISSPSFAPDARPGFYGYGIGVGIEASGRVSLSHSGAFALGAGTNYTLLPSLDLGIVILTNADPTGVGEALAMEFSELVQYGGISRDWYAAYQPLIGPITAPIGELVGKERPSAAAEPAPLAHYAGIYDNPYFGTAVISNGSEGLRLTIGPAHLNYRLSHWDGDSFTYRPFGENAPAGSISEVTFERDGEKAAAMTIEFLNEQGLGRFQRQD